MHQETWTTLQIEYKHIFVCTDDFEKMKVTIYIFSDVKLHATKVEL